MLRKAVPKETSVNHFSYLIRLERSFVGAAVHPLSDLMDYEDLLVVLLCLLSFVERLKASWAAWNGMGVPLLCSPGEKCVSKAILVFATVGRAAVCFLPGGRAARIVSRHQTRKYDVTKGHPGEDISPV